MFESFAAVMMVVVFAVPGLVWHFVEGHIIYVDRRQAWEKFALGLVTRSVFVYLPVWPVLWNGWSEKYFETHPIRTGIFALVWVFVIPVVWGILFGVARRYLWAQRILKKLGIATFEQHPVPTAWDSVFSSISPCFALVTLKDDEQIRGYLGSASHMSSDPEDRDIYLSHTLMQDESGHWKLVENTKGVYIPGGQIVAIELIDPTSTH